MKVEVGVAEVVQIFKELQQQPGRILEMVKADMPKAKYSGASCMSCAMFWPRYPRS